MGLKARELDKKYPLTISDERVSFRHLNLMTLGLPGGRRLASCFGSCESFLEISCAFPDAVAVRVPSHADGALDDERHHYDIDDESEDGDDALCSRIGSDAHVSDDLSCPGSLALTGLEELDGRLIQIVGSDSRLCSSAVYGRKSCCKSA